MICLTLIPTIIFVLNMLSAFRSAAFIQVHFRLILSLQTLRTLIGLLPQELLFDLIIYIPVKNFQLWRDRSFWVEPVLNKD